MIYKSNFVLKGNIIYSKSIHEMEYVNNGYLVCEQGVSAGVFEELPEKYKNYKLIDYKNKIIIPGLVDLHVHAPQYAFRGFGMDLELLDWLNQYTFIEEAKYSDMEYAKKAYSIFTEDLKKSATTRACIFATVHVDGTIALMELLENTRLQCMVGKVNMNRNATKMLLEESTECSVLDTLDWIQKSKRFHNILPIITPRFIPSCSDDLMLKLSTMQKEFGLCYQSHLSENPSELQWVKELCPSSLSYSDAYDKLGAFSSNNKTVMAHCVYLSEEEMELLKRKEVFIAHCPESNVNLASGIAPIRKYIDKNIKVGLGSDVAAGSSLSIFQAMKEAIQVSKLRWRLVDDNLSPLTVEEAFYLGTMGGGEFFGKVGSFLPEYEFDAVVIDDSSLLHPQQLSLKERLERVIYLADDRNIYDKYVSGNKITLLSI
jgi:guanine deaminase